jgi:hypothetical protein
MQLKREDRDLGLLRQRRKRKFGDEDGDSSPLSTPSTGSDTTADLGPTNFCDYAAGLIRQAEISNAANVLEDTSPPLNPSVATPSYTFSPPPVIPSITSASSTGPSNEPPRPTRAPSNYLISQSSQRMGWNFIGLGERRTSQTICARMRMLSRMNLRWISILRHPTTFGRMNVRDCLRGSRFFAIPYRTNVY